jgi:AcrR family transcriptional regulator
MACPATPPRPQPSATAWRGSPVAEPLTPRGRQIVAAARELLEQQGPAALTMRRLADRLGIRAPSLYKHLPDKAALEAAIIATGFEDAAAFEQAVDGATEPLASLAAAYRTFALAHPHLYRLMTDQPLPRDRLPSGLEERTAAPLLHATGDPSSPARSSPSPTAWSCWSSPAACQPTPTPGPPGAKASPPSRPAQQPRTRPAHHHQPTDRSQPGRPGAIRDQVSVGRRPRSLWPGLQPSRRPPPQSAVAPRRAVAVLGRVDAGDRLHGAGVLDRAGAHGVGVGPAADLPSGLARSRR